MHFFTIVLKSGCFTLKRIVPGFSPQRPGFDLRAVYVKRSTATPKLTTNWSYNTNFLKKISFQTSIKMSLKFHFELPSFTSLKKLYSYYFAAERLLAGMPFIVPVGVHSTLFLIFDLWPICCNYHVFIKYSVRTLGSTRSNGTSFLAHISFSPFTSLLQIVFSQPSTDIVCSLDIDRTADKWQNRKL
jgi:hypothetical protein